MPAAARSSTRSARGAGLLIIMIAWSLAAAAHGLATGFRSLLVSRFLLGMGEGGGFPAATKAVSEWFPASERSTAMGIINAGTAVGAVVAPPAIAAILGVASWRWVFVATGATGLVWTIWWMRDYQTPAAPATSGPGRSGHALDAGCSASVRSGVWSSRSSSATPPGISTCSGCPSISTTSEAST